MSTEKFVPITGLDNLTEAQKKTYYLQVCEHFGLPAELNLLEYIYMDSGDGARKLVLWAKKGATDIWRDRHDISVIKLVKDEGDGYVMFTAEGKNGKGRTEMAVGAADTKNRTGKALSDAVMTAQTRSIRRMTLQFVGGGFLDETEVQVQSVTAPMTSIPSAAVHAQPTVTPNAAVGKDITSEANGKNEPVIDCFNLTPKQAEEAGLFVKPLPQTSPEITAHKPRRKRRNTVDFTMPGSESPNADIPAPVTEPAKTASSGFQYEILTPVPAPVEPISEPAKKPATYAEAMVQAMESATFRPADEPAKNADIKPDIVVGLSVEDKKRFAEKMKHYREVVLPIPTANNPQTFKTAGGMEPTKELGGVAIKLRRYAEVMFSTQDLKTLTVIQWEQFLSHLDGYLEMHGAVKLVEQINETVTVIKK
jgi:hypothetical protein